MGDEIIELGEICPGCGHRLNILYPKPEEPRLAEWGFHILGETSCCKKQIRFSPLLMGPASNLVGRKVIRANYGALEMLFREH